MRRLIIGDTTYNWVRHCAGLVIANFSRSFDVMIVEKDNSRPIITSPRLCYNSIYEQRRHDLNRIGKKLNIGKIMNLGYSKIEPAQLATQITFHVTLSHIGEIYHYNNPQVKTICQAQKNVECFEYGKQRDKLKKVVRLDTEACDRKKAIGDVMIGASNKEELDLTECVEKFY